MCACVRACARSLACAHQCSHTKLRLQQCLSNFSNVCEPICSRCVCVCSGQLTGDTVPAISSQYFQPQRPLTEKEGRAIHQSYVNDYTWDRGRRHKTQTGISYRARHTLGTAIFFNALLVSDKLPKYCKFYILFF